MVRVVTRAKELRFSYEFLNYYYEWSIQGIDVRDESLICRDYG